MSTKTLRKRIALVAVAALGAGVLVTSPASATDNAAVGGTNAGTAAGVLNVATTASITGDAVLSNTIADNRSRGLLANSTTQTTSSLTSTATMRSDGEVAFYYTGVTAGAAVTVVVDGGTISDTLASSGGTAVTDINAAKTQAVFGAANASAVVPKFAVTPNASVTALTVSLYETAAAATGNGSAAAIAAIQAGTVSKGSLLQRYSVTVATTSSSGVYSSTYSYVHGVVSAATTTQTNVDETNSLTISNTASAVAYIAIDLRDAYNVSLDNKGALVISGTNGAGIAYEGDAAAHTPTNLTAVSIDTTGTITVARPTAYANKAFSTTVTISWNGAVVGTKTVKFLGEVAKISVSADYVAQNGTTSAAVGSVSFVDDAGNTILAAESGMSAVSSTLNSVVTGVSGFTAPTALYPLSDYDVSCGGSAVTGLGGGSANVVFQYVNSVSGSIVKSAPVKISCAGDATTFTASFDKASYVQGDIATLTISGKDAAGNAANAYDNWLGAGSTLFSITTPTNLTIVTAISSTSVKFTSGDGIKTYKYIVGSTEGNFNAVVSIGEISANNIAAGGGGVANAAVKYTVASSGGVTNADVLKAIVSLIASINKQIAALQKALLKK